MNIDGSPGLLLHRHPTLTRLLQRFGIITDAHVQTWPPGIVRHDVRKGLAHPTGSTEAIYSSHMLEHLYLDEARSLLRECTRVLRPGGIIRLALPDAEAFAAELVRDGGSEGAGTRYNAQLNAFPERRPSGVRRITALFTNSPHRWQPTRSLVRSMLLDAGFVDIVEQSFRTGRLPDLESVEHRDGSVFFEASSPEVA